jgi:hypothetical protein
MLLNLLDRIGDWNPQVFRELKGRLNPRNILITGVVSGFTQFAIFQYYRSALPTKDTQYSSFCRGQSTCHKLADASVDIDWQFWWFNIFQALNLIIVFTILIAGTYLVISDLAREEQRGTLNFLRLSPQSTESLLIGKIFGVPSLLYLSAAFAIPFYLWTGISAAIPLSQILLLSIVEIASCIFWFSAAFSAGMLSDFKNVSLGGFQAWLASGAVLLFLSTTFSLPLTDDSLHNSLVWLRLWNPLTLSQYWFTASMSEFANGADILGLRDFQFFNLPIGNNDFILAGVFIINYTVWCYYIWIAINRRFRNPNSTALSKLQSYSLVACIQFISFGFTCQNLGLLNSNIQKLSAELNSNLGFSLFLIFLLDVGLVVWLMAVILPQRQALLDWARYRHYYIAQGQVSGKNSLWKDLLIGEKSPAILAMAINLLIMMIFPVIMLILLIGVIVVIGGGFPASSSNGGVFGIRELFIAFLSVGFACSLTMIYTAIAQRMLFMKNAKRSLLAIATIGSLIFLPPMMLGLLGIFPTSHPNVWLVSTFPWAAMGTASPITMSVVFLSHLAIFGLLNFNLHSQLKLAGESETKVLLSH